MSENQRQLEMEPTAADWRVQDSVAALEQHPFACVQRHVYERIQTTGGIEPRRTGRTFLTLENLQFIFYKFLSRFTEETGADVLPENQSLEFFAEYVFEAYYGMLDSFDNARNPSAKEIEYNVAAWNKNTIDYLLVSTTRAYNRQSNYIKRYKNYKYGALRINPIRITSKKTKRIEANLLQNYAAIGSSLGAPLYPVRDYD